MTSFLAPAMLLACLCGGAEERPAPGSFLYQPAYALDFRLRDPAVTYEPQVGDIVFMTDELWYWKLGFFLACAGHPHHSGIVVRRSDGRLALLEAGPHDSLHIEIQDVMESLRSYEKEGRVWVRRRRSLVTPEQSAKLTKFAEAQDHKDFALIRLGGQLTLLRSRGPLRTWFMGGPHGERDSYFCAELVMETCVAAGFLDPANTRPSATYPRDFFFDKSYNIFNNLHLNLSANWYPPARWTSAAAAGAVEKK
jgi:hypothetical protein